MPPGGWRFQAAQQRLTLLAVLGGIDVLELGAENAHAAAASGAARLIAGLTAELDDNANRLLVLDDVHDILEEERLEVQRSDVLKSVETVSGCCDDDGLEAGLLDRPHSVDGRVVEFDALAIRIGPDPSTTDLLFGAGLHFVFRFVCRVIVRGGRFEFSSASIDHFVDRF